MGHYRSEILSDAEFDWEQRQGRLREFAREINASEFTVGELSFILGNLQSGATGHIARILKAKGYDIDAIAAGSVVAPTPSNSTKQAQPTGCGSRDSKGGE